ncbi:acyl-CoA dehydrogenase family protein [Dyadobacter sp. NIV53]|uniref:acyl-CoA dehydrogenase family protein n=1 Tax=Dyadobacter sp. NIV53 TaxID=2861765 RepID=UPI001C86A7AE|nr:acyl-CoA dehydrogenase family protein [Dyadobacter sp. NIV53]
MQYKYDYSILQDQSSLKLLLKEISGHASEIDCDGCFPEMEFGLLRKSGLLTITLPGQALSFNSGKTKELLQLLKSIGKASLPVGRVYEGHINALYLISLFGNTIQKERWFGDAENNLFGVWNTQDTGGVKIHDLDNGKYMLEGAKTFCSGAGWIGRPLITGELISKSKKGWQMCVISTEKVKPIQSDSSFWKPLGMRASASYRMDFTGIEINEEDLLGPPDSYYQQPYFGGGALRFAAVQLGGAEAVLEETHRFLQKMKRTEDLFQRARIAEISYLTETGNLWINQAGIKLDEWQNKPDTTGQILAYANMTRTVTEDICLRSLQLAERSVGSRGSMRPQPLERIHRDLTTYLRQPAPDATLTAIGGYVLNQQNTDKLWD